MSKTTITKSVVECYKLRGLSINGWADFTIDADGESGRISIASDYGDFQYFWSRCGMGFKDFLPLLGIDYVADKFKQDEYIDVEKSIANYKENTMRWRRENSLTKDMARGIWNEIDSLKDCSQSDFENQLFASHDLLRTYDYMPDISHSINPMFKKFWEECWSVFVETLRQEANGTGVF